MERQKVGEVFKYFVKPQVAAINITEGTLKVGDTILIQGFTTNFSQVVETMEIDRVPVKEAGRGKSVGVKVKERVRPGDRVYKIS